MDDLTPTSALIAQAALAEVGHLSTIAPSGRLELEWDTPPDVVYRAWNVAQGGTRTWDEFISYTSDPRRRTYVQNIEWLRRHNVEPVHPSISP